MTYKPQLKEKQYRDRKITPQKAIERYARKQGEYKLPEIEITEDKYDMAMSRIERHDLGETIKFFLRPEVQHILNMLDKGCHMKAINESFTMEFASNENLKTIFKTMKKRKMIISYHKFGTSRNNRPRINTTLVDVLTQFINRIKHHI